jgi:hypothetical protein
MRMLLTRPIDGLRALTIRQPLAREIHELGVDIVTGEPTTVCGRPALLLRRDLGLALAWCVRLTGMPAARLRALALPDGRRLVDLVATIVVTAAKARPHGELRDRPPRHLLH